MQLCLSAALGNMAFKQTRKQRVWVGSGWVFFIHSLKKKKKKKKRHRLERFFQVIHFIIVVDEGASNRAVANALHLSCLARDFLLSSFFFPFLPLTLPFWY